MTRRRGAAARVDEVTRGDARAHAAPAGSSAMSTYLLRYGSLALLVAQDTALVLLLRFSRQQAGPMYLSSTAVCCMEAMKLSVCMVDQGNE